MNISLSLYIYIYIYIYIYVAEAQYLLLDAESRAVLVRDDAPEGVFFHRNHYIIVYHIYTLVIQLI